jgi:hypothetical protein
MPRRVLAALALSLVLPTATAARAEGQEGYYYPPVTSTETFERTLAETPGADRATRIGFVTQVTAQQLQSPTPPRYAIFAKGAEAEEMIIVALEDGVFDTLFRARAVMAQLSAPARTTEFFVEQNLAAQATYYDMIKIMGFKSLTLSDGKTWSHRVDFP